MVEREFSRLETERLILRLVGLWAGTALLVLAPTVVVMAPVAALAGAAIAPTLIAGFVLVQRLVPSDALTEGLNWTITGLGVGAAVGEWSAGLIAAAGGSAAILVTTAAGGVAVLVAARGRGRLRPR